MKSQRPPVGFRYPALRSPGDHNSESRGQYRRVIDTTFTAELSDIIGDRLTEREDISDREIALLILEEFEKLPLGNGGLRYSTG